jgi:methyl-accepting chemotaxis protein
MGSTRRIDVVVSINAGPAKEGAAAARESIKSVGDEATTTGVRGAAGLEPIPRALKLVGDEGQKIPAKLSGIKDSLNSVDVAALDLVGAASRVDAAFAQLGKADGLNKGLKPAIIEATLALAEFERKSVAARNAGVPIPPGAPAFVGQYKDQIAAVTNKLTEQKEASEKLRIATQAQGAGLGTLGATFGQLGAKIAGVTAITGLAGLAYDTVKRAISGVIDETARQIDLESTHQAKMAAIAAENIKVESATRAASKGVIDFGRNTEETNKNLDIYRISLGLNTKATYELQKAFGILDPEPLDVLATRADLLAAKLEAAFKKGETEVVRFATVNETQIRAVIKAYAELGQVPPAPLFKALDALEKRREDLRRFAEDIQKLNAAFKFDIAEEQLTTLGKRLGEVFEQGKGFPEFVRANADGIARLADAVKRGAIDIKQFSDDERLAIRVAKEGADAYKHQADILHEYGETVRPVIGNLQDLSKATDVLGGSLLPRLNKGWEEDGLTIEANREKITSLISKYAELGTQAPGWLAAIGDRLKQMDADAAEATRGHEGLEAALNRTTQTSKGLEETLNETSAATEGNTEKTKAMAEAERQAAEAAALEAQGLEDVGVAIQKQAADFLATTEGLYQVKKQQQELTADQKAAADAIAEFASTNKLAEVQVLKMLGALDRGEITFPEFKKQILGVIEGMLLFSAQLGPAASGLFDFYDKLKVLLDGIGKTWDDGVKKPAEQATEAIQDFVNEGISATNAAASGAQNVSNAWDGVASSVQAAQSAVSNFSNSTTEARRQVGGLNSDVSSLAKTIQKIKLPTAPAGPTPPHMANELTNLFNRALVGVA